MQRFCSIYCLRSMKIANMEIYIFKTNIDKMHHVRKLYPILKAIQGVLRWNLDTEDVDRILRVEVMGVSPRNIERILNSEGYYCREVRG